MSKWPVLFMVYGGGEAIDGNGALDNDIERQLSRLAQVCTNQVVAATAQLDSSGAGSRRWVLDPSGRQPVERLPNINVGDPANLLEFADWSAAICPSDRVIVTLSGHGMAWKDRELDQLLGPGVTRGPLSVRSIPGASHHARSLFGFRASKSEAARRGILIDGTNRDYLSNAELGAACQRIADSLGRKIDVLVLDACLMSALEILQELRGSVQSVVGAIDEISAAGIDLAVPAQRITQAGGALGSVALARTIADAFTPRTHFDTCVAVDLAGSSWDTGLTDFREFASQLFAWITSNSVNAQAAQLMLRTATASVVQYSNGGLADISALAQAVSLSRQVPESVARAAAAAAASFRSTVVARMVGSDYSGASGLSIFTPRSNTEYFANRADYMRLQFPNLTGWIAVLDSVYKVQSDSVRLAASIGQEMPPAGEVVELVVAIRGISLDAIRRDRLESAVRKIVLARLAELDVLKDARIAPLTSLRDTQGGVGQVFGFVVAGDQSLALPHIQPEPIRPFGKDDDSQTRAASPVGSHTGEKGFELHIILKSIQLDSNARLLLEKAVRAAVLLEIANIDALGVRRLGSPGNDPATRSVLKSGLPGKQTLGFVAELV